MTRRAARPVCAAAGRAPASALRHRRGLFAGRLQRGRSPVGREVYRRGGDLARAEAARALDDKHPAAAKEVRVRAFPEYVVPECFGHRRDAVARSARGTGVWGPCPCVLPGRTQGREKAGRRVGRRSLGQPCRDVDGPIRTQRAEAPRLARPRSATLQGRGCRWRGGVVGTAAASHGREWDGRLALEPMWVRFLADGRRRLTSPRRCGDRTRRSSRAGRRGGPGSSGLAPGANILPHRVGFQRIGASACAALRGRPGVTFTVGDGPVQGGGGHARPSSILVRAGLTCGTRRREPARCSDSENIRRWCTLCRRVKMRT